MFTTRERQMIAAICDTLAPSLDVTPDEGKLFARKASDIGVPDAVTVALETVADPTNRFLTRLVLFALDNPVLNWVLGGPHRSYLAMTLDERTDFLRRWSTSSQPMLRRAFQGFKRLALYFFYTVLDDSGTNPNWSAIRYPGPPTLAPAAERTIKPLPVTAPTTLYTDVVIVGSGAGGGVVAGELAKAGLDVIVLEKGAYHAEPDFSGHELASTQRMFENQGLLTTNDLGVVILAGSTLGGGTTVNWCASLRTPEWVVQEWAKDYGVTTFTGKDYQDALDAVSTRINVNTNECAANAQNGALERGAQKLGYQVGTIPRNVKGCEDCGFCNFGCQFGSKQGTLKTYLQDAYQCGARILVQTDAERVIVKHGRAEGVEATVQTPDGQTVKVLIKSKAVVVSAGSLHTPALLMRSGLTNANIGQNLHLHPTSPTYGLYDVSVNGWNGAIMSRVVTQFNNLDGKGYGVALETAPIHPGIAALVLSWKDGQQHKTTMSNIATMGNIIVITRDRDGGYITLNKQGRPVIHYTLSDYDRAHLTKGITEALRVQVAAGAREVSAPHVTPYLFRPETDGAFDSYVRTLEAAGLRNNEFALLSAHQMSSCRMGGNPSRGAIDPTGESFEVANLFVADASALPTATGVNPMLSIMGVSHIIAGHIKAKLGK
jgi:choline dehydrogenase-like flavoprotein